MKCEYNSITSMPYYFPTGNLDIQLNLLSNYTSSTHHKETLMWWKWGHNPNGIPPHFHTNWPLWLQWMGLWMIQEQMKQWSLSSSGWQECHCEGHFHALVWQVCLMKCLGHLVSDCWLVDNKHKKVPNVKQFSLIAFIYLFHHRTYMVQSLQEIYIYI